MPQQVLLVINPRINSIFVRESLSVLKNNFLQFDEDVEVSNMMVICFVYFSSCMDKTY